MCIIESALMIESGKVANVMIQEDMPTIMAPSHPQDILTLDVIGPFRFTRTEMGFSKDTA